MDQSVSRQPRTRLGKHLAFCTFVCVLLVRWCCTFVTGRQCGEAGALIEQNLLGDIGGKVNVKKAICLLDLAQRLPQHQNSNRQKSSLRPLSCQVIQSEDQLNTGIVALTADCTTTYTSVSVSRGNWAVRLNHYAWYIGLKKPYTPKRSARIQSPVKEGAFRSCMVAVCRRI